VPLLSGRRVLIGLAMLGWALWRARRGDVANDRRRPAEAEAAKPSEAAEALTTIYATPDDRLAKLEALLDETVDEVRHLGADTEVLGIRLNVVEKAVVAQAKSRPSAGTRPAKKPANKTGGT